MLSRSDFCTCVTIIPHKWQIVASFCKSKSVKMRIKQFPVQFAIVNNLHLYSFCHMISPWEEGDKITTPRV